MQPKRYQNSFCMKPCLGAGRADRDNAPIARRGGGQAVADRLYQDADSAYVLVRPAVVMPE